MPMQPTIKQKVQLTPAREVTHVKAPQEAIPASPANLKALKAGDFVKVQAGPERFWVHVESFVSLELLVGSVHDASIKLSHEHGYEDGDKVWLSTNQVLAILTKEAMDLVRDRHIADAVAQAFKGLRP